MAYFKQQQKRVPDVHTAEKGVKLRRTKSQEIHRPTLRQ